MHLSVNHKVKLQSGGNGQAVSPLKQHQQKTCDYGETKHSELDICQNGFRMEGINFFELQRD